MPLAPKGPRKVVVGTAMHEMFGSYPGPKARIAELAGLVDDASAGIYGSAAALLDRSVGVAGVCRKVHPVFTRDSVVAEGGVTPGRELPVSRCDFGAVGMQICWDMAFDVGWEELERNGRSLAALDGRRDSVRMGP